jgi:DNA-binding PadR family transcriptional regulator
MSVRHGLLALLTSAPKYGYQLRAEFEAAAGGTWPLNIGQVYTTLQRLERDGLVRALEETDDGQRPYEITGQGRDELSRWLLTPLPRELQARSELALKVSLAVSVGADVPTVLQAQRRATIDLLQTLRANRRADEPAGPPGQGPSAGSYPADVLAADALAFAAEAEVRWLDHVEATLKRAAGRTAPSAGAISPASADSDQARTAKDQARKGTA